MKKIIFLLTTALSFGACQQDIRAIRDVQTTGGVEIELTATAPATRVSVNGGSVTWSEGDGIALFDNYATVNSRFVLTSATHATFRGAINAGGMLPDRVFCALYPYGAGTFSGTACTFDVPVEQNGNVADYLYMVADPLPFPDDPVEENIHLTFRQLMALVEINALNLPSSESIVKIEITTVNPSIKPFVLEGTVDIAATEGGHLTVTPVKTSDRIRVKGAMAGNKASLAIFPVDFSAAPTDLKVIVTTSDGRQYYDYTVEKPHFNTPFSRRSQNVTEVDLAAASRSLPYDMENPAMEICAITLAQAGAAVGNRVYVSSLMGLANRRMPSIYLDQNNNVYNRWKGEMQLSGFTFVSTTLAELNDKFLKPDLVKGYVLVDEACIRTPIAASLAGALDAVILTPSLAATAPYNTLTLLHDASSMTEAQLISYIESNREKFNLTGIVNYSSKSSNATFTPWQMTDFAIKYKYPMCGIEVSTTTTLRNLFNLLEPNSPHFGWAVPYDPDNYSDAERQNVTFGAQNNAIYTVPGAAFMSMSLFSTDQIRPVNRDTPPPTLPTQSGVHYVTIVFSDGDNMSYYNNKFAGESQGNYLLSPKAGNVPLNYMYPPHLIKALTPLHNFYQRNMPANNYLVCGLSGIGYTLPGHSTTLQQAEHYRRTNQAMKECGLDYLIVMDEGTSTTNLDTGFSGTTGTTVRSRFVNNMQYMPDVKGIFYMHYQEYSRYQGRCFFLDGVPVVSFRYCLWDGGSNTTFRNPTTLAASLNAASRDVTGINAYSAVMAHVNDPSFYDVDRIVDELVPLLNSNVVIVDAAQFMELIKQNVPH